MKDNCCTPGCPNERELGAARCPACKRSPRIVWGHEIPQKTEVRLCFWCGEKFGVIFGASVANAETTKNDEYCCSEQCQLNWYLTTIELPAAYKPPEVSGVQVSEEKQKRLRLRKRCRWCGYRFRTHKQEQMYCSRSCRSFDRKRRTNE